MDNTYKECFVEGKKGEQRCYMTTVVIAFYCLSISLGDVNGNVSLPMISIDIPLSSAQFVLLGMYSVAGVWGAFYTFQSYTAAIGLRDCKSGKLKALSTYPSIYNAHWIWVLAAISLPLSILSTAFILGSNQHYLICINIAIFFSLPKLVPLVKPNITRDYGVNN